MADDTRSPAEIERDDARVAYEAAQARYKDALDAWIAEYLPQEPPPPDDPYMPPDPAVEEIPA